MTDRFALIGYFLSLSFTVVVLFIPWIKIPIILGYLLLGSLFFIPIIFEYSMGLQRRTHAFFVLITPAVAMLFVIDPVEIGYYGYDPYTHTLPSHFIFSSANSISEFVGLTDSWPAFYALTNVMELLYGSDVQSIGKYIPILSATAPFMFYLTISRFVNSRPAFLIAMGIASSRTLLLFESKFLDETLAIALLFVFLFSISISSQKPVRESIISILTLSVIVLTHHAVGLYAVVFIVVWRVVSGISMSTILPMRWRSQYESQRPSFILSIISGILFVSMFIYISPGITAWLINDLIQFMIGEGNSGAGAASGSLGDGASIREMIATAGIFPLGALAAISAFGVLSRKRLPAWIISWTAFGGLTGGLYVITLVSSRIIPLDPIRLLIIFIPVVLATGISILNMNGNQLKRSISIIIVGCLIVTQIAAVPPHILYSDPGETTFSEGHYTPSQFAASEWVAANSNAKLVAYEPGLWTSEGSSVATVGSTLEYDEYIRVWRVGSERLPYNSSSIIYDGGDIKLEIISNN